MRALAKRIAGGFWFGFWRCRVSWRENFRIWGGCARPDRAWRGRASVPEELASWDLVLSPVQSSTVKYSTGL